REQGARLLLQRADLPRDHLELAADDGADRAIRGGDLARDVHEIVSRREAAHRVRRGARGPVMLVAAVTGEVVVGHGRPREIAGAPKAITRAGAATRPRRARPRARSSGRTWPR